MKKLNPKILLIAALILSIICGFLVYRYLKKAATPKVVTRQVLVAAVDIQPGTKITENKVKLVTMPVNSAIAGAKSNSNGIIGVECKQLIVAGEQITDHKLTTTQVRNVNASIKLPKDKRAITMAIDDMSGVTPMLKPGMFVDIIKIMPKTTTSPTRGYLLMQKVQVISVGNNTSSAAAAPKNPKDKTTTPSPSNKRMVVLAVNPEDAIALRVAQNDGSILSLSIRDGESINDIGDNTVYGDDTPSRRPVGNAANSGVQVIRGTSAR